MIVKAKKRLLLENIDDYYYLTLTYKNNDLDECIEYNRLFMLCEKLYKYNITFNFMFEYGDGNGRFHWHGYLRSNDAKGHGHIRAFIKRWQSCLGHVYRTCYKNDTPYQRLRNHIYTHKKYYINRLSAIRINNLTVGRHIRIQENKELMNSVLFRMLNKFSKTNIENNG